MSSPKRDYILSHWTCVDFANRILGWPVSRSGDRCLSIHPGIHRKKNLQVFDDYFIDHKVDPVFHTQLSGSVIDLCAYTMFNGDIGAAMDYLAGDFYQVDKSFYAERKAKIQSNVKLWHSKLRPEDIEYLHSRRITDETIRRLQIGYTTYDDPADGIESRIVIPYFKNGEIVYYISRDRTGVEGKKKYKKCPTAKRAPDGKLLPGTDEQIVNIPWGLHTVYQYERPKQLSIDFTGDEQSKKRISKEDWLVIAEGCFDALSFEQEKFCVLSPMGGYFNALELKQVMQIARLFRNVLIIFDNDGAGSDFQRKMAAEMFGHRVNFYCGAVPSEYDGKPVKDVSDYYSAGGDLEELVADAYENGRGIDFLVRNTDKPADVRAVMYKYARFAEKSDVIELYSGLLASRRFFPAWLKAVKDEALKAPGEAVIVEEMLDEHKLKYLEGAGFYEYAHGVWEKISDNAVKRYACDMLGRFASNSRMENVMRFAKARVSVSEEMNRQPVINFQNGVLLLDEGLKFVPHSEDYSSSIQMTYRYDPQARCDMWHAFVEAVMQGDKKKIMLLQEMAGYILFPTNKLEKCFFLMGDGGNGKGVFMDTLKAVFHPDNCSALELSHFAGDFNPMMLRYSLVNLAAENRVDLKGAESRIKAVVSGDDIIAAHKGVDAVKFSPRCKCITACNDFVNSNEITHAFLRRLIFIRFNTNFVQQKAEDVNLREKLRGELPGIMNWCIEGYLRLLQRVKDRAPDKFTVTPETEQQKREFLESINPLVSFFYEKLEDVHGMTLDSRTVYSMYKEWGLELGYKVLSLNACTRRIKQVFRERRPDVRIDKQNKTDIFIFPPEGFEDLESGGN